jgi:hypothetical protein
VPFGCGATVTGKLPTLWTTRPFLFPTSCVLRSSSGLPTVFPEDAGRKTTLEVVLRSRVAANSLNLEGPRDGVNELAACPFVRLRADVPFLAGALEVRELRQ